jgi:choline dehydrogenase-like flavoprotein
MLDGGIEIEPERAARVERIRARDPRTWKDDHAFLAGGTAADLGGVPLKRLFGSDFPYREPDRPIPLEIQGPAIQPSLARGGLSNVWGACALPVRQTDIEDWPIDVSELEPHYRSVLDFVDLSATCDDLAEILPLYTERATPLEQSREIRAFVADLARSRERLRARGFHFGASRLAVRARARGGEPGCVYCGLCLYGCPHGLIYNAADTLDEVLEHPGFRYEAGVVVHRFEESGQRVELRARAMDSGEARTFEAGRVFLACGSLSTPRLVLRSLDLFDRPVHLQDSQYFLLPLVRARRVRGVVNEPLHTLSQAFIEMDDDRYQGTSVHLQVYSYNDLVPGALRSAMGPLSGVARPLVDLLVGRVLIVQGYLHSRLSPRITAILRQDSQGAARLELTAKPDPDTSRLVKAVGRKLLRNARSFRALPVMPALQIAPPGRGFHTGAAFPMRDSPGELECDSEGRLFGHERVHIVDASCLPSIPATTITLTVMANAHRIGSVVDDQ